MVEETIGEWDEGWDWEDESGLEGRNRGERGGLAVRSESVRLDLSIDLVGELAEVRGRDGEGEGRSLDVKGQAGEWEEEGERTGSSSISSSRFG